VRVAARAAAAVVAAGWCLAAVAGGADDAPAWREHATDHFRVLFVGEPAAAATSAGTAAERHYSRIATELGLSRPGQSWRWDRRVVIRLYPSEDAFRAATRAPEWAVGRASARLQEIACWAGQAGWEESVLPHEITHLMLRAYLGQEPDPPAWFVEGVTQWMEPDRRAAADEAGRWVLREGRSVPAEQLNGMAARDLADPVAATAFYRQAVSLVGFLFRHGGSERFGRLLRQVRDGKTMEAALRFTYPETLRSMKDLETRWAKELE